MRTSIVEPAVSFRRSAIWRAMIAGCTDGSPAPSASVDPLRGFQMPSPAGSDEPMSSTPSGGRPGLSAAAFAVRIIATAATSGISRISAISADALSMGCRDSGSPALPAIRMS